MLLKPGLMTWILAVLLVLAAIGISTLYPYRSQIVAGEDPYRNIIMEFEPAPDAAELAGKEVVRVGIYVLSVGNLDTTTGTYTIDLFLNFYCETIPCDPSNFDVINAAAEPFISGTLASAIFYHLTLTSSVPPVGYLTYGDQFMILQYVFITAALATSVALFLLVSAEKRGERNKKLAQQIDRWTRHIIPPLWIFSMVALHLTAIGFPGLN